MLSIEKQGEELHSEFIHVIEEYQSTFFLRISYTSPVILDFSKSSLAIASSICLFCNKPFMASSSVSSIYCVKKVKVQSFRKLSD